MAYIYGLGADAENTSAVLARLAQNYPQLRTQLMAEAQALTEPPSLWQRGLALLSTENVDVNAAAGRSLLNAIQRYDATMNQILNGDYSKAAELQANMQTAVAMWGPDKDKPWSNLMDSIIADLKALPREIGKAAGDIFRGAAAGAAEGLGPWGMLALAGGVGLVVLLGAAPLWTAIAQRMPVRRNPSRRRRRYARR